MNPMQYLFTGILLAACGVSAAQDCSDIAGDWEGTWSETDCDGVDFSGDWTAAITSSCDFTGGDTFVDISGMIDPLTGVLTASPLGTDCGTLLLTGTFQNDLASGDWTYSFGGGGTYEGNKVLVDTDGDGDPDVTDPDDDDDGIGDAFDTDPLVASNECTGGDGDNATLGVSVVADLTCAARVSIDVQGTTQVLGAPAHLHLIAPFIEFQSGFSSGWLTVISADPCPGCSP